MKVDENGFKWMKLDEVDVSGKKWMKISAGNLFKFCCRASSEYE